MLLRLGALMAFVGVSILSGESVQLRSLRLTNAALHEQASTRADVDLCVAVSLCGQSTVACRLSMHQPNVRLFIDTGLDGDITLHCTGTSGCGVHICGFRIERRSDGESLCPAGQPESAPAKLMRVAPESRQPASVDRLAALIGEEQQRIGKQQHARAHLIGCDALSPPMPLPAGGGITLEIIASLVRRLVNARRSLLAQVQSGQVQSGHVQSNRVQSSRVKTTPVLSSPVSHGGATECVVHLHAVIEAARQIRPSAASSADDQQLAASDEQRQQQTLDAVIARLRHASEQQQQQQSVSQSEEAYYTYMQSLIHIDEAYFQLLFYSLAHTPRSSSDRPVAISTSAPVAAACAADSISASISTAATTSDMSLLTEPANFFLSSHPTGWVSEQLARWAVLLSTTTTSSSSSAAATTSSSASSATATSFVNATSSVNAQTSWMSQVVDAHQCIIVWLSQLGAHSRGGGIATDQAAAGHSNQLLWLWYARQLNVMDMHARTHARTAHMHTHTAHIYTCAHARIGMLGSWRRWRCFTLEAVPTAARMTSSCLPLHPRHEMRTHPRLELFASGGRQIAHWSEP